MVFKRRGLFSVGLSPRVVCQPRGPWSRGPISGDGAASGEVLKAIISLVKPQDVSALKEAISACSSSFNPRFLSLMSSVSFLARNGKV